ncbi:MAG: PAS domain S-box protein, partial [candidate division Zixibacteria bacterium]|nr:PAS domain S-box protein [candidate division Zixibacteria bacterium]
MKVGKYEESLKPFELHKNNYGLFEQIMKSLPIKTQILILTLSLVTISLGFLMFQTIIQTKNQLHGDMEKRVVSMISIIATNVGPGIEFEDETYIQDIVAGAFEDKDMIAVCVCGKNDENIYFQSNVDSLDKDEFDIYCPAIDTVIVNHINDIVIVSKSIKYKGEFIGDIWMAMSEKDVNTRIESSLGYLLGLAALVLLVIFIAGNIIASKIVNPIRNFETAAKRIQNGDMVTDIDISALNRDFIPLGMAFNKMRTSLDCAFDELKASRQNLEAQVEIRTSELQNQLVERRKTEEALKESRQKLELHIQQTPLGVIQWDLNFHAVEWNSAAEGIFGYSAEEAIGRHPCDFIITKEIKDIVDEIWAELITQKGGTRNTNENITKNGETIICEWYNTPLINNQGETVGVASLVMDITDRMHAEKQKIQRLERVQNQRIAVSRLLSDNSVIEGDFDNAAKSLIEIVATTLNVGRASIWMFDEGHTQLECIDLFEVSKKEHSQGTILKVSDSPNYFNLINNERIISSNNAQTDPRTSEFSESYLKPLGITSLMDTSFLVSGKLLGVV